MTTEPAASSPEQTLAWEAEQRPRAALAAWVAGLLTIAGGIVTSITYGSLPNANDKVVTINDALGDLAAARAIPPGRFAAQAHWIADHPVPLIAGALLTALASFSVFGVLAYLFRAARARNPGMSQAALVFAAIGAVAFGVGGAVVAIGRVSQVSGFSASATNRDALDAFSSAPILAGQLIQQLGGIALAFAFVMISLNAMRAGLLTRFMGVLGIIAGITLGFPVDQPGVIRTFWLVATGFLIAGRWPRGVPPAWTTGLAQPWPSSSRVRMPRPAGPPPVLETPAPVPPSGESAGQRRKRRKRR